MNRSIFLSRNLFSIAVPTALLVILVLLMKSSFLIGNDLLNFAITADLVLTVPIIYFLLIRKSEIPKTTVIPVMIIGILLGSYLLPTGSQSYLEIFKTWALPIIELSVVALVIVKVRRAIKRYTELKDSVPDFFDALKSVCDEMLPKKLVILISTEIAVLYYGFISWRSFKTNSNEFSYHKDSGTIALLASIMLVIGIETIVLHSFLLKWNQIVAWVITCLSLYSVIQIFGFLKSMSKRPIVIQNEKLLLRYGIMNETMIDLKNIESIEITSRDLEMNQETRKLSILGDLESHNMVISLKNENTLFGLYGIKRKYKNLAIYVDKKMEFKNYIDNALQQNS